jgi:hypothetical protein
MAVKLDYYSPASEERLGDLPRRWSADVTIEDSVSRDAWGRSHPPREEHFRDIYRPEQCIGSDGFYLYSCDRLRMRRCATIGSSKGGMKVGYLRDAIIEDFYGRDILVSGTLYWSQELGAHQLPTMAEGTPTSPLVSEDVRIINPTLYDGASLTHNGWLQFPIQLSLPQQGTSIEGGHIWARKPPNIGYLQAWEGVEVDVRGVTFHGPRPLGASPGDGLISVGQYGGARSLPSSINADFIEANEWREAD